MCALEQNTGWPHRHIYACVPRSIHRWIDQPAGLQHDRQTDPTHANPTTHAPDPPTPPNPHRRATAATRSSSAGPPRPRCRAWWAWAARPSRCRTTRRRTSCSRRCSRGRSRWVGGSSVCPVMNGVEGERSGAPDASALSVPKRGPPARIHNETLPSELTQHTTHNRQTNNSGDGLPLASWPTDGGGRRRHHAWGLGRDADGAGAAHPLNKAARQAAPSSIYTIKTKMGGTAPRPCGPVLFFGPWGRAEYHILAARSERRDGDQKYPPTAHPPFVSLGLGAT